MATMYITVLNQSGQPMPGVLMYNGRYDTSPCPWFSTGCTSGEGKAVGGTTDANGQLSFTIPWTCPGQWSADFYADGFNLYPWQFTTGPVTGDIHTNVVMVANQQSNGNTGGGNKPGGNPNEGNIWDQLAAGGAAAGGPGGGVVMDWLSTYWWVPVLIVVLVVVLILALRHRSGAVQLPTIAPSGTLAVA